MHPFWDAVRGVCVGMSLSGALWARRRKEGIMSKCDQASVVWMPLAPSHYFHPPTSLALWCHPPPTVDRTVSDQFEQAWFQHIQNIMPYINNIHLYKDQKTQLSLQVLLLQISLNEKCWCYFNLASRCNLQYKCWGGAFRVLCKTQWGIGSLQQRGIERVRLPGCYLLALLSARVLRLPEMSLLLKRHTTFASTFPLAVCKWRQ